MKISIITVCYNSAATIATAIESVLTQTYPLIEYIVVDGGSKDGTAELIRKYAEGKFVSSLVREFISGDARECANEESVQIRQSGSLERSENNSSNDESVSGNQALRQFLWLSEPDEGMYDAINKGIRMATGDVIGILNADDFLADDRAIERIAQEFQSVEQHCLNALLPDCLIVSGKESEQNKKGQKIDVVYGDVRFVKEDKSEKLEGKSEESGQIRQSGNQAIRQFSCELASLRSTKTLRDYSAKRWKPWMLQWGYMPPHPGVYIRRECFEKWGAYKLGYHIAADYELLIRFLRKEGLVMNYLSSCIVGMRPGGKSTKNWRSNVLLNQEIVRGNRENGYFCCLPMLLPKYLFKIFEFIIPWFKSRRHNSCSM